MMFVTAAIMTLMLIMVMMAIMMMTVSADVGVELVLTPWLIQLLLN